MNNIYPFHNASKHLSPEDIIIYDTSFVLSFAGYTSNKAVITECDDFIFITQQQRVITALTVVNLMELRSVLLDKKIKDQYSHGSVNEQVRKELIHNDPELFSVCHNSAQVASDSIIGGLSKSAYFLSNAYIGEIDAGLIENATQLQRKYRLPGLNDALIVAIALKEGATGIATTDSDFTRVKEDNLKIFVDRQTYNKNCT